jgi:hypothetical protein
MELSDVVDFEKHSAIKSQILANFVAEWTEPGLATEGAVPESPWLVCCDGAWRAARAKAAAILTPPSGITFEIAFQQRNRQVHQQHHRIRSYFVGAP